MVGCRSDEMLRRRDDVVPPHRSGFKDSFGVCTTAHPVSPAIPQVAAPSSPFLFCSCMTLNTQCFEQSLVVMQMFSSLPPAPFSAYLSLPSSLPASLPPFLLPCLPPCLPPTCAGVADAQWQAYYEERSALEAGERHTKSAGVEATQAQMRALVGRVMGKEWCPRVFVLYHRGDTAKPTLASTLPGYAAGRRPTTRHLQQACSPQWYKVRAYQATGMFGACQLVQCGAELVSMHS